MVSITLVYEIGIIVSVMNVVLWTVILSSQIGQLKTIINRRIKISLLIFGVACLVSNFVPLWYDFYQISRHAHPSNITIAYTVSQYVIRTVTACMFYIIYRS